MNRRAYSRKIAMTTKLFRSNLISAEEYRLITMLLRRKYKVISIFD